MLLKGRPAVVDKNCRYDGLEIRQVCRSEECKMKKQTNKKKRLIKFKHMVDNQIDCHDWATKMEIHRLISGKPDIKVLPRVVSGVTD